MTQCWQALIRVFQTMQNYKIYWWGNSMQVRQPYFEGRTYRISGELSNTDSIMNNTFWTGVYPGLSEDMLSFVADKTEAFFGVNF